MENGRTYPISAKYNFGRTCWTDDRGEKHSTIKRVANFDEKKKDESEN